jgi:predicted methyltransferase
MRTLVATLVLALTTAAPCIGSAQGAGDISAILSDASRPQAQRDQDEARKPAQVIELLGVGPGAHVADLLAGGGYWTRILVPLVGPEGRVYAGNNPFYQRFYTEAFDALLSEPAFANVVRIDGPVDQLSLPADGSLDAALMVLAYHDLFLTEEDRAAMNRAVFSALKPGGTFVIVDHAAAPGSGPDTAQSLHRIDPAIVIEELRAAGFELGSEADFLNNPEDPHTAGVFDQSIRGQTDRFVLQFVKPR